MSILLKDKKYSAAQIETILSTMKITRANLKAQLAEIEKNIKEVESYGQEEEK